MRRFRLTLILLLILLGGGHFLYWYLAVGQLEAGYARKAEAMTRQGWTITAGAPQRGGWPLHASLTLPNFSAHRGSAPDDVAWSAESLTLQVALIQPLLLQILPAGAQSVKPANAPEVPYQADTLRIDIPLELGEPLGAGDLLARELHVGPPAAAAGSAAGGTISLLQGHVETKPSAQQGEPALDLTIAMEGIGLPTEGLRAVTAALGSRISSLSAKIVVTGPIPRGGQITERAAGWRDGKGVVQISKFALGWGKLGLNGDATLGLDGNLQPAGTGTVHVVNYSASLDALAASGAIKPGAGLAVKAMLAMIGQADKGAGDEESVELPFALKDHALSVHDWPLPIKIPAIVWP